jgi:hypothetical protein
MDRMIKILGKHWKDQYQEFGPSLFQRMQYIKIEGDDLYLHSYFFDYINVQIVSGWYSDNANWHKVPKEAADKIRKDIWWFATLEATIINKNFVDRVKSIEDSDSPKFEQVEKAVTRKDQNE